MVKAIHLTAETRPKNFAQDPLLSAQLNSATSLHLHKDKNEGSRTWLIAFGNYTGGRLWIESPVGVKPPPDPKSAWQRKLRGEFHDVKNKRLAFDPQLNHCVEKVRSGTRRSLALFTPKNWRRIPAHFIEELIDTGFYWESTLLVWLNMQRPRPMLYLRRPRPTLCQ